MTDAISGEDLVVGYGRKTIVDHQSIHIPAGQITGLIGPNGSGKSTLLKALAGINPIDHGHITINGQPQAQLSAKALAKALAYLAQAPDVPGDLTVATLVKLGRYAYHRGFFGQDPHEKAQVRAALVAAKVAELANRPLASLSGGQRQRAFIAMTLAHDSPIIMLDEPTTYLDLTHQLDVLNLMQHLNQVAAKTIIVVLHDLNQAARYCDQLVCLHDGQVVATGSPKAVLTAPLLAKVFQVSAQVVTPAGCDYPQLLNCQTLVSA
ncbi:ABC transporter ATP-binding protein [Lacticaseibacillus baoqingensis]|uniref:ABC transporter ATP-binding protein n=1 Tax=Lacticaseibacillus baoqingensis TaxID=2486013 RepID=A0ABW4E1J6_9LACO|nr:ABC transporter ATP-binding protein [Lacticaseibacillus baoqingensis]